MSEPAQEYDAALVALLETVWGEGFLSPGGAAEVERVLDGIDLRDATVLDLGCGTGGAEFVIAGLCDSVRVVGVDVGADLIERARARAIERGLAARVTFQRIEPGPLPFADASVDVVFSKDALIHIPDKEAIAREIRRVLRPGGAIAASDWLRNEGPVSARLQRYIDLEGLGFGMGTPAQYRAALEAAGFVDVALIDRNAWYRGIAREELAALTGPLHERLVREVGAEFTRHEIDVWSALVAVLESGELLPTHLRARRPEGG
jgi:phosphoethanolamine N-methyltransferase